jgi:hypothetical protein
MESGHTNHTVCQYGMHNGVANVLCRTAEVVSRERVGLLLKSSVGNLLQSGMPGFQDDPEVEAAVRRLRLGIRATNSSSSSNSRVAATGLDVSAASTTEDNVQYLQGLACGVDGTNCPEFYSLLSSALLPESYSSSNVNDTAGALITSPVKDQRVSGGDAGAFVASSHG